MKLEVTKQFVIQRIDRGRQMASAPTGVWEVLAAGEINGRPARLEFGLSDVSELNIQVPLNIEIGEPKA